MFKLIALGLQAEVRGNMAVFMADLERTPTAEVCMHAIWQCNSGEWAVNSTIHRSLFLTTDFPAAH